MADERPAISEAPTEAPAAAVSPRRRPRSRFLYLLVPLLRALLFLFAFILVQGGVTVLLSSLPYLVGGPLFQRGGFGNSVEFALVGFTLCIPFVILMTWVFARFLDRRTLASLGARWPDGGPLRQLATATLGAAGVLGVWLALVLALPDALAAVRFAGTSAEFQRGPSWWPFPPILLLLLLLLGFVLQGGLEEWVMRGYLYHTLRERWRPWVSALVSSAVFSLLHAANPSVSLTALANIVLAGMVLAALVERTGSLWSATVAHGVWNFAVACLLSVPVSGVPLFHLLKVTVTGNPELTGGGFGPEGSAVLTAIGLALTAVLWRGIWRRQGDRPWAVVSRTSSQVPGPPSAPEDIPSPVSP